MQNNKTKQRLIDVTEELLALHGAEKVSIKNITERAGTRIGAVNYYFDGKINLFAEVIKRRAHIISTDRLEMLADIGFEGQSLEDLTIGIVESFVKPVLTKSMLGEGHWRNYCRLVARTALQPNSTYNDTEIANQIMTEDFDDVAHRYIEALSRALPGISNRKAHHAYQFMLSCTLYAFTQNERLDRLSSGAYKSKDLDKICDDMVIFISGGLQALVK